MRNKLVQIDKMPTEQEVIDAVVLDEEVPHFIREEMVGIMDLFKIVRNRRGARRDEAWKKLQELIQDKLHSQYESYKGLISTLKVKATKAWVEEDCSTAIIILRESVEKLILQKQHWKQEVDRLVVEKSELSIKLRAKEYEKGYEADSSGENTC